MPMKVFLHYEEGPSDNHVTLKMTLPKKWEDHPIEKLKNFFVESYNKKKPENTLIESETFFKDISGKFLKDGEIIKERIKDRADIFLVTESPFESAASTESATTTEEKGVRCRNHGCNKFFNPEKNEEGSCKHHSGPPVFHDLKKGWSCCPEKTAYDWDDFEKIEGCVTGQHSTEAPKVQFGASPTVEAARRAGSNTQPQPVVKSVDDFNKENPNAITAAAQVAKATTNKPPQPRRADGKAKCIRFGCYKEYDVANNPPDGCRYHTQNGVFHDTVKYWGCCPDAKKYDFDEFMAVPGCAVGSHSDGHPEE